MARRVAAAVWRSRPEVIIALDDRFGESGEPEELAEHCGIGASAIANAARAILIRRKAA